jgi:hypothetical protein
LGIPELSRCWHFGDIPGRAVYQGRAGGVATPPWTRQRVPASAAVVVIVAVLAIIADAEQYLTLAVMH